MSTAEYATEGLGSSQHILKKVDRLQASDSPELRSYMQRYGLKRNGGAVELQDGLQVGAAGSATAGFLWLIFRFLVGAAVADAVADITNLKHEVEGLKHAINTREDKLDQLLLALASK